MKRSHIIGIVLIAVAIAVIISTVSSSSNYADFSEAFENPRKTYHVVGQLNLEKEMSYDPKTDANKFSFYLIDINGEERKVVYNDTKPQDFERSEQIVLIGKANGEEFQAKEILMKCPSKYNDGSTPEELQSKAI
ncbi:MAG: cytochrome c maturation protein CcmE [Bacteroidia bacterium]|nr:cytochrome c maturation protein CcmE [Bacteroidia bacterium]